MPSKMVVIAIVAVGIAIAGVGAFFLSSSSTGASVMKTGQASQNGANSQAENMVAMLMAPTTENAPALGSSDARVTIVEFGDYQCTWCHRWHESTKDTLLDNYVKTGKVRFLFKDFPINDLADRASSMAAEASYCAADQGKYWEYHDELYSNWKGENTGWVTKASLQQFALNIGIDEPTFSECLDSGKHRGLVRENYNLAVAAGLNATPSFIVLSEGENPKLISGAHPYTTFQRVIDEAYTT